MCGRFQLDSDTEPVRSLIETLEQKQEGVQIKHGDIYPTDITPVFISEDKRQIRLKAMIWGFPRWDNKGVIFNARAETALEKSIFREPLLHHPALVPTTGFYEWQVEEGSKKKTKYLFREPGKTLLYLAGFFKRFPVNRQDIPERFTILTTEANPRMTAYHNRMPLLIHHEEAAAWLSGEKLEHFLHRIPFDLEAVAIK